MGARRRSPRRTRPVGHGNRVRRRHFVLYSAVLTGAAPRSCDGGKARLLCCGDGVELMLGGGGGRHLDQQPVSGGGHPGAGGSPKRTRLENRLHTKVCDGTLTLREAQ